MTGLGLAAIVQLAVLAAGADETYAEAHRATNETGRPMVVMVTADWCFACQQMKNEVIPQCRQRGLLRRVAFAVVNLDRERELGTQLTNGGPIPQLLMYRRTAQGWRMNRLIGGQNLETIEGFIKEGVSSAKVAKKVEPAGAPQTASKAVVQPVSEERGAEAGKVIPGPDDQTPPPVSRGGQDPLAANPRGSTTTN